MQFPLVLSFTAWSHIQGQVTGLATAHYLTPAPRIKLLSSSLLLLHCIIPLVIQITRRILHVIKIFEVEVDANI